jgi:hypothetical protein
VLAIVATACLAATQTMTNAEASAEHHSPEIDRFVLMETTGPVYDVLYKDGQDDAAKNGAYGPNISAPRSAWYLEYQRAGAYDLTAGVTRQDRALMALGLRMMHFGLDREAPNGSFPGSASPFHGTAMYLSEAAPALVMLRASPYVTEFARDAAWQIARMQKAAYYLASVVGGHGQIDDPTKNHRFYEAATALGAVGVLAGDHTLVQWSTKYAWEGIAMERPGGVMPEDGGHDSGYQALGMVNAARYLELVATGGLYQALFHALDRGESWELSRVRSDGSINQQGDTRTAGCKEHDLTGQCKTVFYAPIYSALAHWARVSGDLRFANAAYLVWEKSGYGTGLRPPGRTSGR